MHISSNGTRIDNYFWYRYLAKQGRIASMEGKILIEPRTNIHDAEIIGIKASLKAAVKSQASNSKHKS